MPYIFSLHQESLKRKFAVYVVVAKLNDDIKLYVGKTGDNREGCNPLISRCGNHFSYNKIHSQVRNKLDDHEQREYIYIFDHFDDYSDDEELRRNCIDRINEMERWLNQEIQLVASNMENVEILNKYLAVGRVLEAEKERRNAFRTEEGGNKIQAIVLEVKKYFENKYE